MIKQISFVLVFILSFSFVQSQKNFITKSGQITFSSKTPLEDVEATNNQVYCSVNTTSGKIQFAVLIKGFTFENSLMQKHFNEEDYMFSDQFPKATFVGQINNLKNISFQKNGTYQTEVSGKLTVHGVSKNITASGLLILANGILELKSNFKISPADFKISVPDEISKTIEVIVDCKLK